MKQEQETTEKWEQLENINLHSESRTKWQRWKIVKKNYSTSPGYSISKKTGLPEWEDREYRREEIMSEITEENFQNWMSCFKIKSTQTMKTDAHYSTSLWDFRTRGIKGDPINWGWEWGQIAHIQKIRK